LPTVRAIPARTNAYRRIAKAVASELESQGIAVNETLGFGQELPIRHNGTEASRARKESTR
jgi:outer membrane protein OmpA-like peptidoglycan-associated protein